jgi:hypothetical protein
MVCRYVAGKLDVWAIFLGGGDRNLRYRFAIGSYVLIDNIG